jgi:IS1 family transposase
VANVLPFPVQVQIVATLIEGVSIRGTARLCKVDKDAVMRLGLLVGLGCLVLHDRIVRAVPMALGEVDELWAYVGRHEKRIRSTDPAEWGDAYTLFAVDAVSKLVPSFLTGRRDLDTATAFMLDLRRRVAGKPQLSVDGWLHWPEAVRRAFGLRGCDLGVVIKEYQGEANPDDPERRYTPGRVKYMHKRAIFGEPNPEAISTSLAERLNLTGRMGQRRLTRLTNGYSRKRESLRAAFGLHFAHYNLVRVHETIDTTPAVAAGLAEIPWSLGELVREALAAEPLPPAPPSPVPLDPATGEPLPTWETWRSMTQQDLPWGAT